MKLVKIILSRKVGRLATEGRRAGDQIYRFFPIVTLVIYYCLLVLFLFSVHDLCSI